MKIIKKEKKKRSKKAKIISALILIVFVAFTVWGNVNISVTEIAVESEKLPSLFDGYRIAQISDLHNAVFGENNERLTEKLKDSRPDIIVITGDIVDMNRTDFKLALDFVYEAVKIAPVYYVTGNHEAAIDNFDGFEHDMINAGVNVLGNKNVIIEKEGQQVNLIGVDDPMFNREEGYSSMDINLNLMVDEDKYNILLSHRPELFEKYISHEVDLVFTGHAHGGQFRLPFIGGIVAPNQGFFPKYDSGLYQENNTSMIVSRGIGNSIIPVRFNNTPEIVVVELRSIED